LHTAHKLEQVRLPKAIPWTVDFWGAAMVASGARRVFEGKAAVSVQ
jgi:hypothetical protein